MSIATEKDDQQPYEAEELVRSLGDLPNVSAELRSRVLLAASQAATDSKRQRGWVIAAGFAATCAAAVLAFAFFGGGSYPTIDPMADQNQIYNGNETIPPAAEETINQTLQDQRDVISSGMLKSNGLIK
ncbi:MAG: hypothetical protein AB8G99_09295 [Planctomycetaceae bacterium]